MTTPKRVLTFGESMGLIRGDALGGFERLATASVDTGGAEGNTAIGLSRLGVPVTWLGRVGHDALGRRVVADLRSEGVDVVAVTDESAPTGLMLKSTPRAGATVVNYYRAGSAGSRLDVADLDRVDFSGYDMLHVTGVTLAISLRARDAVFEAVRRARAQGLIVSFAVNHRAKLWSMSTARSVCNELLPFVDILFASDEEARMLTPAARSASLNDLPPLLASSGPSEVMVTLGSRGSVAGIAGTVYQVPAERISPVDTVGAGDAFAAGYLAGRARGLSTDESLRVATRCGAWACLHPSDWQGAAREEDLAVRIDDVVIR